LLLTVIISFKVKADQVYQIVSLIPEGRVTTYSAIAKKIGLRSARSVGQILHRNPNPEQIPCHRVVSKKGSVAASYAFGGAKAQVQRLREEGIELINGHVNLKRYLWQSD
jgi:O-6-methylguanine DNA methyltransferase